MPQRPLFCPAIYEHKAKLTGVSVSDISLDSDKLAAACIAEWKKYSPDMLTIGVDIYNVEPEIIGAKVCLPKAADAVPHLESPLISSIDTFNYPVVNNIYAKGRAAVFVEAAVKVNEAVGREVMVRGSVSGPYSIAAALMGIEPAIMTTILEPEKMNRLLDYCCDLAILYAGEYVKRGLGVCMFDSQAVPPLLSPDTYKELVLPRVQKFSAVMKAMGAEVLEYVTGGNTTAIADLLTQTGFDIILADFPADVRSFLNAAKDTDVIIRRNISPVLIENGMNEVLEKAIDDVVEIANENKNVIIGTGVLSYNVASDNIIAVRDRIRGF